MRHFSLFGYLFASSPTFGVFGPYIPQRTAHTGSFDFREIETARRRNRRQRK